MHVVIIMTSVSCFALLHSEPFTNPLQWPHGMFIRCKLQILTRSIGHLGIFCPLFYEQSIVNSDMILLSHIGLQIFTVRKSMRFRIQP